LSFTLEELDELAIAHDDVGLKDFEGDTASNTDLIGAVDGSHSPDTDERINLILIEGAPHEMVRVLERKLAPIERAKALGVGKRILAFRTILHVGLSDSDLKSLAGPERQGIVPRAVQ
jgi:hypothetical protein